MKCTVCYDFCPVTEIVSSYPGPKKLGPDDERFRFKDPKYFDKRAKLCLNCKRCEIACPSNINISGLILRSRFYHEKQGLCRPRNYLLASTDITGKIGTSIPWLANTAASLIFPHGGPRYASQTFADWFKKEAAPGQDKFEKKVTFFHGCYVNYNYPQLGKDFIKVMNAAGIGVNISENERCCGLPLISNGFKKQALVNASSNLDMIRGAVAREEKILLTSSSCAMVIRNDYKHLLNFSNSEIMDSVLLATKYLYEKIENNAIKFKFKECKPLRVAYHTACHMAKLGWNIYSIELLKLIPGVELIKLDENCCGVAGTYGFKPENKKRSKTIGKKLFEQINELKPDIVATDCETCKWQIEMNTCFKVVHPISILADAIV